MKTAMMSLFVEINGNILPDDLDWKLMKAARQLAKDMEYFDASMYACAVGDLTHAHACEMPVGANMVLDLSADKIVHGVAVSGCKGSDMGVVPNHTCMVLVREETGIKLTMCKGRKVPNALPGVSIPMADKDPQHVG